MDNEELKLLKIGEKINIGKEYIDDREFLVLKGEPLKEGEEILTSKLSIFFPNYYDKSNIVLTIGRSGTFEKSQFPLITDEEWENIEKKINNKKGE